MTEFLMQKADSVLVAAAKGFGLANTRELKICFDHSEDRQVIIDARLAAVYILECDLKLDGAAIVALLGGSLEGVQYYIDHARAVVDRKLRDLPAHITRIREQIAV